MNLALRNFVLGFLLLAASSLWAGERLLQGTITLADGEPVTDAYVFVQVSRMKDAERLEFKAQNGSFQLALEPEYYLVTIMHQGYEPFTINGLDLFEEEKVVFEIVLDRPKSPVSNPEQIQVLRMEKSVREEKQKTMIPSDQGYTVTFSTELESEAYMLIVAGLPMTGPPPYKGFSPNGFSLSTAKAVDGEITVTVPNDHLAPREKAFQGDLRILVGDPLIGHLGWFRNNYMANYYLFMEKRGQKNPSVRGLESMITEGERRLARLSGDAKLVFAGALHQQLGMVTKQFDLAEAVTTRIARSPHSIAKLPFATVIEPYVWGLIRKNEAGREQAIAFVKRYLEAKPNRIDSAEAIEFLAMRYMFGKQKDTEKAKFWLRRLIDEYPGTTAADSAAKDLQKFAMVGDQAPAFTLKDDRGNPVSLKDFRGKYVLLDFWAKSCTPCVQEIPNLVEVYGKLDKETIEFVSIGLDMEGQRLRAFANRMKMTWPQLWNRGGFSAPIAKTYGVSFLPNILLIGPEGKVLQQNDGLRGEELLPTLEKYLNSRQ